MRFNASVKPFLRSDALCALIICLLPALAYVPALVLRLSLNPMNFGSGLLSHAHQGVTLGGPWLDPNASFTIQALGRLSADDWLHGRVPWWNPYTAAGIPLAGEMQTVSLFLPFVFLLHFTLGVIYLKISLEIVAGLGTYALLRRLGLGRLAAFVGAALYEFNGPFAWFAHGPIMPIAFLPLLLLGIERALTRAEQKRRGGWALIGIALGYSLYAGFPETAFLDGLLALVWTLYRLATVRPGTRFPFAMKVVIGGVAGLLVAAPILLPFSEYQGFSAIGHIFPIEGLLKISLAPLFMPYIYGPIGAFSDADSTHRLQSFWGSNGGYLNLTVLFLAIMGLFSGRRARGLRILLAVWLAVFLGRVMNAFHLAYLFSLIPLMNVVGINRYCEPAWAMAAAILAAYAIDDWRTSDRKQIAPMLVSGAVSLALAFTALRLGSGVINSLLQNAHDRHYPLWLWGSLAWTVAFTTGIAVLYCRRPNRRTISALGALIVANAFSLYAIPSLAGLRHSKLDFGLVSFLQHHLELERFYTLGPFAPNYGAYFHIASINHNAVPIPSDWIRYIDSTLDPNSVIRYPSIFVGWFPGPSSDREKAVRMHLGGFEATAVKYILANRGTNPFVETSTVSTNGPTRPLLLHNGESLSGILPNELSQTGFINGIGIVIGMYGGPATGYLNAQICANAVCASGIKTLKEAQDRERLEIRLDTPLRVNTGDTLRYAFAHIDTDQSADNNRFFFIWCGPAGATSAEPPNTANGRINCTPSISLTYQNSESPSKPVYRSQVADVFRLPQPKNYFEVQGGPCKLSEVNRESVHVFCTAPAVLIRREFFYPGWRAFLNDQQAPVTRFTSIFQAIDLPAGDSKARFSYRPSHIGWAYAAAAIGCLCLLAGLARRPESYNRAALHSLQGHIFRK